jgi:hypothetical protein
MRLNQPSGSLNQFTETNKNNGFTYPRLPNGTDRDPHNPHHWRWNFTFKLLSQYGRFITKSVSVPRLLIPQVQAAISNGDSVPSILNLINSRKMPKSQKSLHSD